MIPCTSYRALLGALLLQSRGNVRKTGGPGKSVNHEGREALRSWSTGGRTQRSPENKVKDIKDTLSPLCGHLKTKPQTITAHMSLPTESTEGRGAELCGRKKAGQLFQWKERVQNE